MYQHAPAAVLVVALIAESANHVVTGFARRNKNAESSLSRGSAGSDA